MALSDVGRGFGQTTGNPEVEPRFTVKKSIAAIASRWLQRKASQRLARSGFRDIRSIQRETVLSEMSKPSIRSSPWMRGAPQVGFSAIIWQMRSRTCFDVRLLPTGFRTFEITLRYQRNPARCHRTTVSGVTTIRTRFHPADQNTCAKIQKALPNIVGLGLGCLRFNAASCWRRAKFSRSRSHRARNTRQIAPSRSANRFIMSCCYRIFLVEEKGVSC